MKQKLSRDGIFIFNERQKELLEIEPEVRLKVIDAMFAYNLYGELPTDPILKAYFGKFKKDIDDGKAKKKDISDKRKEAIAKRWGNKPVESLEEEKGTEPPQPLKPEFEPMDGQEIEVVADSQEDEIKAAIKWFRLKENQYIIIDYKSMYYSEGSSNVRKAYEESGYTKTALSEAFKICRKEYERKLKDIS